MRSNYFLLAFIFIIGCTENNNRIIVDSVIIREWKTDSLGCLGYRKKIADDSLIIFKSFIGKSCNDFIMNFGSPNLINQKETTKIYIYWTTCSLPPKFKGVAPEIIDKTKVISEPSEMCLVVNEEELITDVNLIVP